MPGLQGQGRAGLTLGGTEYEGEEDLVVLLPFLCSTFAYCFCAVLMRGCVGGVVGLAAPLAYLVPPKRRSRRAYSSTAANMSSGVKSGKSLSWYTISA